MMFSVNDIVVIWNRGKLCRGRVSATFPPRFGSNEARYKISYPGGSVYVYESALRRAE